MPVHAVLDSDGGAGKAGGLGRKRGWIRWERGHSNMMWHADIVQLPGGKWLVVYEDDASRRIVDFGVFKDATAADAIAVLHEGAARHGRPASRS